jgi:hypothetical protein
MHILKLVIFMCRSRNSCISKSSKIFVIMGGLFKHLNINLCYSYMAVLSLMDFLFLLALLKRFNLETAYGKYSPGSLYSIFVDYLHHYSQPNISVYIITNNIF